METPEHLAQTLIHKKDIVCTQCEEPTIYPLTGGIININEVICSPCFDCQPVVASIYINAPERRDKELFIRQILMQQPGIPVPTLLDSGDTFIDGQLITYMVKELIPGDTLYSVLHNRLPELSKIDLESIALQLGNYLARIHQCYFPCFGEINGDQLSPRSEWRDVFWERFLRRAKSVSNLPSDIQVGPYQAIDIQVLLPILIKKVQQEIGILDSVTTPVLVHGDCHFLNVMANSTKKWGISAILDMEDAHAGDAEVDLAIIESQLNLSPEFSTAFKTVLPAFLHGYSMKRRISPEFKQKRKLYHIPWSLSYFEAVLQMDTQIHPITEQIIGYMHRHYQVLKGISQGLTLEEIGVPCIVDND
ncbi:aminoglycoside phosphotransferase family protein [Candidatus Beckwithbacteria bacterium]|nr:aminoglycoside phosphotransferase family protein [Candidatus Beckwithbacteria bacterium]